MRVGIEMARGRSAPRSGCVAVKNGAIMRVFTINYVHLHMCRVLYIDNMWYQCNH